MSRDTCYALCGVLIACLLVVIALHVTYRNGWTFTAVVAALLCYGAARTKLDAIDERSSRSNCGGGL